MRREKCNDLAKLILAISTIILAGCETLKPNLLNENSSHSSLTIKHEAIKELEVSALAGNPSAQNEYGLLYIKGEGVPQDYKKARKWFLAAAKQGNHSAQANLAIMFEDGLGVPKNQPLAYALFTHAARSSDPEIAKKARENSERMFSKLSIDQTLTARNVGIELTKKDAIEKYVPLDESEITVPAKPPQMSRYEQERNNRFYRWKLSDLINAAQNGDVIAQGALGERYVTRNAMRKISGWLPPHNPEAGLRWLRLAASKGDPGALLALASTLEQVEGDAAKKQEALRLTLIAAESGYSSDAQLLAGMRLHEINDEESERWLALAKENGSPIAASAIGRLHYRGDGAEKNYKEAIKWLRIATADSNPTNNLDEYQIGFMYYQGGYGISQNYPEALKWFRRASNHGNPLAKIMLGKMYAMGEGIDSDNILAYTLVACTAKQHDPDLKLKAGLIPEKKDEEVFSMANHLKNYLESRMTGPEMELKEQISLGYIRCKGF